MVALSTDGEIIFSVVGMLRDLSTQNVFFLINCANMYLPVALNFALLDFLPTIVRAYLLKMFVFLISICNLISGIILVTPG